MVWSVGRYARKLLSSLHSWLKFRQNIVYMLWQRMCSLRVHGYFLCCSEFGKRSIDQMKVRYRADKFVKKTHRFESLKFSFCMDVRVDKAIILHAWVYASADFTNLWGAISSIACVIFSLVSSITNDSNQETGYVVDPINNWRSIIVVKRDFFWWFIIKQWVS